MGGGGGGRGGGGVGGGQGGYGGGGGGGGQRGWEGLAGYHEFTEVGKCEDKRISAVLFVLVNMIQRILQLQETKGIWGTGAPP